MTSLQMKLITTKKKIRLVDGIFPSAQFTPWSPQGKSGWGLVRSIVKIGSTVTLICVLVSGSSHIGATISYFNDIETSIENKLQAATVDFRGLSDDTAVKEEDEEEYNVGLEVFRVDIAKSDKSIPLFYTAHGELDASTTESCGTLLLSAMLDEYHYEGLLTDFSFSTSTMGLWQFVVSFPVENTLPAELECKGVIVFDASALNASDSSKNSFTDKESYTFEVYNWGTVTDTLELLETESTTTPEVIEESIGFASLLESTSTSEFDDGDNSSSSDASEGGRGESATPEVVDNTSGTSSEETNQDLNLENELEEGSSIPEIVEESTDEPESTTTSDTPTEGLVSEEEEVIEEEIPDSASPPEAPQESTNQE